MSLRELLAECSKLYEREGITSITFQGLKRAKLYFPLYKHGVALQDVVKNLGLETEYKLHRETQPLMAGGRECLRWNWNRVVSTSREVAEKQGSLPPAAWFQQNGKGSLVQAVYALGKTWADLRAELKDFSNSNFVESRNGLRWLSHAEASLSNFLYARGIEHRKGGRYAEGYAAQSGYRYGLYDLRFAMPQGRWVDVEVWGDKPLGFEIEYRAKRLLKESFNKDNPNFLGIEHRDCYDEVALARVLEPYVGRIDPYRFDKPTDALIRTTHWSNADELLIHARQLAASMPDGKFPTEEWLRKRGKWAGRPGESYNTLSVYIKIWIGGVRQLRSLLNQERFNTTEWTKEKAVQAYEAFYRKYAMSPDQARARYTRKGDPRREMYLESARVSAAVSKYAGGSRKVREALGIELTTRPKSNSDD